MQDVAFDWREVQVAVQGVVGGQKREKTEVSVHWTLRKNVSDRQVPLGDVVCLIAQTLPVHDLRSQMNETQCLKKLMTGAHVRLDSWVAVYYLTP